MVRRSKSKSPKRLSPSLKLRKSKSPSHSPRKSPKRSPRKSPRKSPSSPKRISPRKSPKRSKSRSPIRIHLTKGSLGMYGYKGVSTKTSTERRKYLKEALKHEDALPVFRKLNALYVVNKNKNPCLSAIFESDRNWVQSKYM
jgi:hypothetical protein